MGEKQKVPVPPAKPDAPKSPVAPPPAAPTRQPGEWTCPTCIALTRNPCWFTQTGKQRGRHALRIPVTGSMTKTGCPWAYTMQCLEDTITMVQLGKVLTGPRPRPRCLKQRRISKMGGGQIGDDSVLTIL